MEYSECARYISDEKVLQRRETADRLAREYHAEGIIYEQMKYCDYWGFERALVSHIMAEEYGWACLSTDCTTTATPVSCVPAARPLLSLWRSSVFIKRRAISNG